MNSALADFILDQLFAGGVREICLCPAGRNAPFVAALSSGAKNTQEFKVYYFFEERSAAFFALGRARATGTPVAVITTSGTAAGELFPAVMEGYYSGIPLIAVTADRPRSYRGSGAPQTAEQVGLFGQYTENTIDIEGNERPVLDLRASRKPLHLNICFDEPLLDSVEPLVRECRQAEVHRIADAVSSSSEAFEFFRKVRNPLVIVSMLNPEDRERVALALREAGAPVYLESTSGLREDPRLADIRLFSPDGIMADAVCCDYPIDGVVRIGGIPTLRLWRDLEEKFKSLPVLNISSLSFTGLSRKSISLDIRALQPSLELKMIRRPEISPETFLKRSREKRVLLRDLLRSEPSSEPSLVAALSAKITRGSKIYLGNSLPIREWDLCASDEFRSLEIWASRGLNGIDGQVSSFLGFSGLGPSGLGFAGSGAENWGLIGDLTAMYDLPGPWILPQLEHRAVTIAVINNGGGKIFSRMFPQKEFLNSHTIRFKAWAELWQVKYEEWKEIPSSVAYSDPRVIEIIPDEAATARFWKAYDGITS